MSPARKSSPRLLALPLIIGGLFSLPAMAEISDTIHPYVAGIITYDDNLLRLDKDANPNADTSDTYRTAVAGVDIERMFGRQLLTASAKVSKVSFNRFTDLDYTGKEASAKWDWKFAEHFSGRLGGFYSDSLASFSDFHSSQRTVRTDKKIYGDINWRFHPSWQVHAGRSREEFDYDLASQAYNNRTENISDVGFDYLAKSGSTVGLVYRRLKGGYPDTVFGTSVIDNGYEQDEVKLNVKWQVTGVTQVIFLGGRARRTHNVGSLRDESGNNYRVIANWSPREQVQVTGMLWREFSVAEGSLINSALATGQSADVNWRFSSKISLNGRILNEKRNFRPLVGLQNVQGLSDTSRNASLGVNYQPTQPVSLGLSVFGARRSGSAAAFTNSFRSKGVAFNASVKF